MAAGTDLPRFDALALAGNTATEVQRAALHAVLAGTSVGERQEFLDALGLLPTTRHTTHGLAGFQAGCVCRDCRKAGRDHNRKHTTREVTP
ncbi:hypothetical protein [Streptomyces antibioticus]|uniref:Uncharacterized protein n=1 Tax=Streptomyces antibioticus TaxID=1890 RepID=A0AAE6YDT9_STRAT|nr:hypothetical protein [Streptomyces antibioticus]OOQ47272.1 hypothetical protein AFM16_31490 [Streptomyces antibioticus]QIT47592.1 hypothetical protein HCX60_32045 [Streptomyces antibioticus]